MKRENGFYWILINGQVDRQIAFFDEDTCFITGQREPLSNPFFVLSDRIVFPTSKEEMEPNPEPKDTFEENRQKLWMQVYYSLAKAPNRLSPESAARWADAALSHFDKIFKK